MGTFRWDHRSVAALSEKRLRTLRMRSSVTRTARRFASDRARRFQDARDLERELDMAVEGAASVELSARQAHGECDPSSREPLGFFRVRYMDHAIRDTEEAIRKYESAIGCLGEEERAGFEAKLGLKVAETMLARDKLKVAKRREQEQWAALGGDKHD